MHSEDAGDGFVRFEVSESQQPDLRLYRRLYLARIDLEEAKACVVDLLDRRIPLPRRQLPSPLLLAMTTAFVVAYARPFIHSRGLSSNAEKAVPGVILKGLTAKQRELHEALLRLRNKEIAHSDADVLDMALCLCPEGDSGVFRNVRVPFLRSALRDILKLIESIEKAVDLRCADLRAKLPNDVWL